jgi:peptide deformylase
MAVLDIVLWPDTRLTETCVQIEEVTDEIRTLAQDMLDTMYAAKGRGLAASQVGAMHRVFVMDVGWKEGKSDPLICINPMLSEIGEDRATMEEGCLSIPGVLAEVNRPSQVQLVWSSLEGARYVQSFDGFRAACVQHELDHLDGIVTLDHLSADIRVDLIAEYQAAQ